MALLFVPADLEAAENKRHRRRLRRHERMQVEQHRREMNVASNLAGLINKNNPAHPQNILPYGRACMSAGSSIPLLLLVWCRLAPFPAQLSLLLVVCVTQGRLVADLSERIYSVLSPHHLHHLQQQQALLLYLTCATQTAIIQSALFSQIVISLYIFFPP